MMASMVVVVVVWVSKLDPNLGRSSCSEGFKYQLMQQPLYHYLFLFYSNLYQVQTFGYFTPDFSLHWIAACTLLLSGGKEKNLLVLCRPS